MRRVLIIGLLLLSVCAGFAQTDSVTVIGQFINKTGTFPKEVTLICASDLHFQQVAPVGGYGQFRFSFPRTHPAFYLIQTGEYSNTFPIGESESVYRINITGDARSVSDITVQDSKETEAFRTLVSGAKMFGMLLDVNAEKCETDSGCYQAFMPLIKQVKQNAAAVATTYPKTFAGKTLAGFFNFDIPDQVPGFKKNLQQNYLKQITWNDLSAYDNFFTAEILRQYIRHFADTSKQGAGDFIPALFVRTPDPVAANKLCKLLFNGFSSERQEESLSSLNKLIQTKQIPVTDEVLKTRIARLCASLSGNPAPELKLKNTSGKLLSLHEKAGAAPVTLLVFWSPSCDHCREQMPVVKKLFNKYRSRGLEIFAVAMDADSTEWIKFIRENHLEWDNVIFRHGEDNDNVEKYSILQTPTFVVIDRKKMIVNRLAYVDELDKIIGDNIHP